MENRKYLVEIQLKEDFDYVILQSQWFDTTEDARNWFDALGHFDREFLTASIMSSIFDEDDTYGDIDYEEEL